jgi:hypothetical protein
VNPLGLGSFTRPPSDFPVGLQFQAAIITEGSPMLNFEATSGAIFEQQAAASHAEIGLFAIFSATTWTIYDCFSPTLCFI